MKIANKISIALVLLAVLLSGCTKDFLHTEPEGGIVTTDQRDHVLAVSPEKLIAGVQGIYALLVDFNIMGFEDHNDFGYPALVLMSELWGQDMVQMSSSYGWFWSDQEYSNRNYAARDNLMIWTVYYKAIKLANDVIGSVDPATEDPEFLAYLGQAKAMRAWAYLHLAQLYQHTYVGNEDALGVPIVTEKTTLEGAFNNPRKPLRDVYTFILKDLNDALENLDGFVRNSKVEVDQNVVYGLMARTYLTMERWGDAAKAANQARAGYAPMTGEQYNDEVTGFNYIGNPAWMWGSVLGENSAAVLTGIVNYPSHLGSLNYGYAWAGGMFKAISVELYDQINPTDARKNAFIGDFDSIFIPNLLELPPYANIKFKPYRGVLLQDVNANDWPLMRVEEMYLIEAEALAMSGSPGPGKDLLEEFIQGYRDPDYVCPATDPEGIQEAVWIQRRIELWGEGFAWFDLKRLRKPSIRSYTDSNFDPSVQFDLEPGHNLFLQRIPQREIQSNKGIPETANNPVGSVQ